MHRSSLPIKVEEAFHLKPHLIDEVVLLFYFSSLNWEKEFPEDKDMGEIQLSHKTKYGLIPYIVRKVSLQEELLILEKDFDKNYQYYDDYKEYSYHYSLEDRIRKIKTLIPTSELLEE